MIRALAVTGPTASGKTAVSLSLAKEIGAHIICCDSMQIYKFMDIGTAKPTPEEKAQVPHYMTDFLPPTEDFSAQSYRKMALDAAEKIVKLGKIPLFVGGTGLYIDTLLRRGADEVPESDPEYQSKLLEEYQGEGGAELLWQRLNNVDPVSAEKIHRNNVRRVIRALEIFEKTGKTKTYFDEQSRIGCDDVSIGMITLDFHDRENLYKRCDERVDKMISEGLVGEVEGLYSKGLLPTESTAAQAIGYKEIVEYLKREITLCEAVEKVKLSTRRYAKRQLTWFRHSDAVRIYADGEDGKMRSYDELCREVILAAKGLVSEWSKT